MKTIHGYDDTEKVLTQAQWDIATTEQRQGFITEGYRLQFSTAGRALLEPARVAIEKATQ